MCGVCGGMEGMSKGLDGRKEGRQGEQEGKASERARRTHDAVVEVGAGEHGGHGLGPEEAAAEFCFFFAWGWDGMGGHGGMYGVRGGGHKKTHRGC